MKWINSYTSFFLYSILVIVELTSCLETVMKIFQPVMENTDITAPSIGSQELVVSGITSCAVNCNAETRCQSFTICEMNNEKICKLFDNSWNNTGQQQYQFRESCTYYEKACAECDNVCTRNKAICGRGFRCVPNVQDNSHTCVLLPLKRIDVNAYLNGGQESIRQTTCESPTQRLCLSYCEDRYKRKSALLFQNIAIPKGALVKSAKIKFTQRGVNTEKYSYTIRIAAKKVANANASYTQDCQFKVGLTDTIIGWGNHQNIRTGKTVNTPEIKNVVQEIIDMNEWESQNGIMFVFYNIEYKTRVVSNGKGYRIIPEETVLTITYH